MTVRRSRSSSESQNSNFFHDGFNAVKSWTPLEPFSTKLKREARQGCLGRDLMGGAMVCSWYFFPGHYVDRDEAGPTKSWTA